MFGILPDLPTLTSECMVSLRNMPKVEPSFPPPKNESSPCESAQLFSRFELSDINRRHLEAPPPSPRLAGSHPNSSGILIFCNNNNNAIQNFCQRFNLQSGNATFPSSSWFVSDICLRVPDCTWSNPARLFPSKYQVRAYWMWNMKRSRRSTRSISGSLFI